MKHYHCPIDVWDCPYYKDHGEGELEEEYCLCSLESPIDNCDDFFYMWEGYEPEDYTDDTEG